MPIKTTEGQEPILNPNAPPDYISPPLPATTTAAEDIVTAGQRKISLIWEITQSLIALAITGAIIYSVVTKTPTEVLANAFFLIIGFYFARTNHQAIGGIGPKPTDNQQYVGR